MDEAHTKEVMCEINSNNRKHPKHLQNEENSDDSPDYLWLVSFAALIGCLYRTFDLWEQIELMLSRIIHTKVHLLIPQCIDAQALVTSNAVTFGRAGVPTY